MSDVRPIANRDRTLLLAVGAAAWFWAALWLQRLPYFTDDYDRWIAAAHNSTWGHALFDLINPWGGIDATWGFTYRPVIVVWFKLFGRDGADPSLFFLAKAGLLAALATLMTASALRAGGSWLAALFAPLLLLTSHGVFASMAWGGDLAVMADLCILGALCSYAWLLTDERRTVTATLLTVTLSLLAMQTKGDGRLLGAMFVFGMIWADSRARWRAAIPTVLAILMALPLGPWAKGMPFLGNKALPAGLNYVWHAPSLAQSWSFTLGGTLGGIEQPTLLSVSQGAMLWPLGWAIAAAVILALPWDRGHPRPLLHFQALAIHFSEIGNKKRKKQKQESARAVEGARGPREEEKQESAGRDWPFHFRRLIAAWSLLSIAATSSYPAINPFYQHRYAIDLVAPIATFAAIGAGWASGRFARLPRIAAAGVLSLAAIFQTRWGVDRMLTFRESFGSVATIADRLNREMARHTDAKVRAYIQPYIAYDYWPDPPGTPRTIPNAEEIAHLPAGAYVYSWDLPFVPDVELIATADGATGAWLERFFPDNDRRGFLSRHAAPNPVRTAGRKAAQAGRWTEAIPLLTRALAQHDTVLERHLLGMSLLKSGRYAEAVQALTPMTGPGRQGPRPVRYNLALALLQSGRAREAAIMYERLVREEPGDVDSLYNLAVAYRVSGQLPEAVQKFRATLALKSNHPGAIANLRELGERM